MPHRHPLDARTLQLVGFCVATSVAAQLMLRHGMATLGELSGIALFARAASSPWVLGGLLVHLLGTVVWLLVLSRLDLSAAYPLGSLNYVLITLFSALLLHEQVPLMRWTGTSLILGGILVVARGERRRPRAQPRPAAGGSGETVP